MFAATVLDFEAAGAVLVHWLPHAAGMRRRRGDCQSNGGKSAHEHENKQQSGGQAVHGWFGAPTFPPKDRLPVGRGASLCKGWYCLKCQTPPKGYVGSDPLRVTALGTLPHSVWQRIAKTPLLWYTVNVTRPRSLTTRPLGTCAAKLGVVLFRGRRPRVFVGQTRMENQDKWMELCELASREQDPARLLAVTQEITRLLEEKEKRVKANVPIVTLASTDKSS
jgi:hypothetical protein